MVSKNGRGRMRLQGSRAKGLMDWATKASGRQIAGNETMRSTVLAAIVACQ